MIVNNLSFTNNSSQYTNFCTHESTVVDKLKFFYFCTYTVLVFPPSAFILCLGYQRWKQQCSSSTAMSHSDFFTYNMAALELIGTLGAVICIYSKFTQTSDIEFYGLLIGAFPWNAQMMFPLMVCVERYLAVVQPITYLRLRQTAGVRIRNISTVVIWVQCSGGVCGFLLYVFYPKLTSVPASVMAFCLITLTFCSLSILCVLIRQRPGKVGQDKMKVDRSKQKALKIILIIMGVLFFRFGGNLVCYAFASSLTVNQASWCLAIATGYWFTLPSSLVLPLLFLYRNGKIPDFKIRTK